MRNRRKSRFLVVAGSMLAVVYAILDTISRVDIARSLFDDKSFMASWVWRLLLSPWIGALVALGALLAYAWIQHDEDAFDQLTNELGALQAKADAYQRSLDGIVNEHANEHQQIADALTDERAYAIKEFMHRQFDAVYDSDAAALFARWEADVAAWHKRLLDRMSAMHCTRQEIHAVDLDNGCPFVEFHDNVNWSHAKSLLKFRLDQLADVVSKRAQLAQNARQLAFRAAASLPQ